MTLPGETDRAERFARLLDDPNSAPQPEFAGLVAVVERLRTVDTPGPAAEFQARLRRRLLAEATTALIPPPRIELRADAATPTDPTIVAETGAATDAIIPTDGTSLSETGAATDAATQTDETTVIEPAGTADAGGAPAGAAGPGTTAEPATAPLPAIGPRRRGRRDRSRPAGRQDAARPTGPDDRPGKRRRPRLSLIAVPLVVLVLAGVAVTSSRNALPGDPLYALKRGTENAQLALARGDENRGLRYLELARTRIEETTALAGRNAGAIAINETLGDMDQQTAAGVRLLTSAAVENVKDQPLVEVGTWTAEQYRLVVEVLPRLPADAQARAADSVRLLRRVSERVLALRSKLGCSCLAGATMDDLGLQPCDPCGTPGQPANSTSSSQPRPTESAGPPRTAAPSGTAAPTRGGRPSTGPGGGGAPSRSGSGGSGLPLPLPTGGGSLPLPSIPGLPLPTSIPLPIPLPTGSQRPPPTLPLPPLPTGGLPLPTLPTLPGLPGGAGG